MIYVAEDRAATITTFNRTSLVDFVDSTADFDATIFWYEIDAHVHLAVIPTGAINGVNMEYVVSANQIEVLLNGLHVDFTQTPTGFTLDKPPVEGDVMWCEVIRNN